MKWNIGYGFALGLLALVLVAMFAVGCETAQKRAGFEAAGYLAASKAIAKDVENVEKVEFVADAIAALLEEESILFEAIETWYAKNRLKVKMDPVERRFLEVLFIEPAWEKLKSKYGGKLLDLQDERVRADLWAFEQGLRLAL
jgi:hypothetical protein